jgi:hypothetical protein
MRPLLIVSALVFLYSCESKPGPAEAPKTVVAIKPPDESRRFSKTNLVSTEVVDKALLGKSFMPGGTLAKYQKGSATYEMFVAKTASATDAALLLPDWKRALTGAKLVPSFGGYFGTDNGRPVFIFSKGPWIAGIVGLSEKDADAAARTLASNLN